ncbi:hypothetical protein MG293_014686 [Ovis ammon polii]|uniref:Liprin-alpha CC2 domain-containing protein n=1 Tax=Ovis ammon polii TaxID=230172 RepID=A0AAD4U1H1_OVIAM|nr:hypothetical protein MG293_014686 [Ovis ammon polii]
MIRGHMCRDGKVMVTDCTPWSNIKCVDQEAGLFDECWHKVIGFYSIWPHQTLSNWFRPTTMPRVDVVLGLSYAVFPDSLNWPEGSRLNELATSTEEELNVCREQLVAREEEIALLNAERNNTRLLLEHMEFLVSRYTPSLQTTVGKWQAQSPDGMTSELEVLKSLKILFEHHKALDKKRTRDEDLAQVIELKEIIKKKSWEQREMKDRLAALSAHVTELEKDLDTARKDLLKSKEVKVKLQQDIHEAMAQKEDMEKRITTLEKRYLAAQCKAISVHNLHDKLENEIANKDSMHRQKEDKDRQLQECLELADQKLQQMLTEVVAELPQLVAVLSKVQPLKDQDRERRQQASVLANVGQLFKSDKGVSDGKGDRDTLFSMPALLSPRSQADAKTPAGRIQKQLDRINEESWLIQKDKEKTDQRAEGIESRVGSGSFSNLRRFNSSSSLNLDPASSHAGSFPPSRGRSMPERRQPSPEREDKLGFMTLDSGSLAPVQAAQCPGALLLGTAEQRHHPGVGALGVPLARSVACFALLAGPGGNPSKSNSCQDSLQKAPKKKGITSSIGRWFGKKEKGRPGHASKEALGPDRYQLFHGPCNPELSPEMSQAPGSLLPAPARDQSLFRGHWAQAAYGELATSTEELNICREQLLAREEEIALLNTERNNIMLLVEHLECRVSQYIPSLQPTAGKWQAQSPDGMTSELEVLKLLKSLFEHHKALDKKRTRDEDLAQVIELQDIIEKKSREQREMRDRLAALSAHVTELEKDLDTARKDLLKSKEANVKLQQDVREAMAQKEDMEKRITTLEKRYLAAQRKAISVHNLHDKLENEIANKDSMHRQNQDLIRKPKSGFSKTKYRVAVCFLFVPPVPCSFLLPAFRRMRCFSSSVLLCQELATSTEEELNVCREQLLAREEEIALLNAERNNTRLLLEHLEFLVSRYTPSLQTTVGKWQAQSPEGMTSELEVLKSLKILFEHHKALDKKRTRDEDLAQVVELKEIIKKKSREQREMRDRLAALSAHVTELEKDLDTARKDLLTSKEVNMELQQDVREDNIGYLVSMEGPEMDFESVDRSRIGSKLYSWFEHFLHGV